MAGSPLRRPPTPASEEDDAHSRQTRKIPPDVVRQVMRAVDASAASPADADGTAPRAAVPLRQPRSGTRVRVSPQEIAAFLAAREDRETLPQVDTYAVEPATLPPPAPVPPVAALGAPPPGAATALDRSDPLAELPEIDVDLDEVDARPTPIARTRTPGAIPLSAFPPGAYPEPEIADADAEAAPSLLDEPRSAFLASMAAVVLLLGPLVYLLLR